MYHKSNFLRFNTSSVYRVCLIWCFLIFIVNCVVMINNKWNKIFIPIGPKTQCNKMWHVRRRYTTAFYLVMLIIVFAVAVAVSHSSLLSYPPILSSPLLSNPLLSSPLPSPRHGSFTIPWNDLFHALSAHKYHYKQTKYVELSFCFLDWVEY